MKHSSKILLFCLSLILISCNNKKKEAPKSLKTTKPIVFAGNYPIHYFAEKLAGENINLYFPIPRDSDPAFWKPNEEEIQQLQSADIMLLNGSGYETWRSGISLPKSKIINTSEVFKDQLIYEKNAVEHTHGGGEKHNHGKLAFTTWLDFELSQQQLIAVKNALIALLPKKKEKIQVNYESLKKQLVELDILAKQTFSNASKTVFYASHPVYQYLSRAYEIKIASFHWEPNQFPSESEWERLEKNVNSNVKNIMLWEDEPLTKTSERLKYLGIEVVVFKPMGNMPNGDTNFILEMNKNLERVK